MRPKIIVGQRVGWPIRHGEAEGVVIDAMDVGARQLLTATDEDGERHTLIVGPSGFDGVSVLAALPGDRAAEGLARLIVSGCDPKIPIGCQLNILAAAVLAAGKRKPRTKEGDG